MDLISHGIFALLLVVSLVCGLALARKKKLPLFYNIVMCGIGCMLLGELFYVVFTLCYGNADGQFHLGMLGTLGCFAFFLSASYGQIDGLGDNRKREYRKYRLIPLVYPALYIGLYVFVLLCGVGGAMAVFYAFAFILMAAVSYYNLKHLIIPDVDFGIFTVMRRYNILVLVFCGLYTASVTLTAMGLERVSHITSLLLALDFLALPFITAKGVEKWYS